MEGAVGREGQALPVHVAQDIAVVVLALPPAGQGQVLGAQEEDIGPAQVLDRGALPHIAEILKARDLQFPLEGPAVLQVLGGIDQDAAPFVQGLGAYDHIVLVLVGQADDLGVPLVLGVGRIGAEQGEGVFFRPAVIAQPGQAGIGVPGPVRVPVVSRIIEVDLVPDGHG